MNDIAVRNAITSFVLNTSDQERINNMIQQYKLFANYLPATDVLNELYEIKNIFMNCNILLFLETEHTNKHEWFLRDIKIAKPKTVNHNRTVYQIKNNKGYLTVIKAQ